MKKLFTIFVLTICLNLKAQQFQKLLDFNGTNGANPTSSLICNGNYLYGMTQWGGVVANGRAFKIETDGTNYVNLVDFWDFNWPQDSVGAYPMGSFSSDGTFLYGMTQEGGANGQGVVFKIKPDGTNFRNLFNFNYGNGSTPLGDLISDGVYLYGMTCSGGAGGVGVVFKIKPDGTGFDTLINFNETNGSGPSGNLISDGTYLYGMTQKGGSDSLGVIFKVKTDGTGYSKLLDFNGSNGKRPVGSLINDGTYLYGMTYMGGANDSGLIFKIKTDGTGYSKLLDFNGSNGKWPYSSLISVGTWLYGMTSWGGANNEGLLFKIKPDGTGYTNLMDFNGSNGAYPAGNLISANGFLYGMTKLGGTNNKGVIFKFSLPCHDTIINNPQTICAGNSYIFNGHTYTIAGVYNDSLQSIDGCDSIISTELTVNTLPIANYTLTADATPHVWDVTPSISGGSIPYAYQWSWGDGTTTDTLYTSHIYTTACHYNVCLTAIDANGCSSQYCENDSLYRTNSNNTIVQINVIQNTTGISQLSRQNSQIKIYPNPTSSTLQVTGINNQDEIKIVDVLGNEVLQSKQGSIDVSNLQNGVYFVQVGTSTQKFIVQH